MQLPLSVVFKVPPQAFLSLGPRLTHLSPSRAPFLGSPRAGSRTPGGCSLPAPPPFPHQLQDFSLSGDSRIPRKFGRENAPLCLCHLSLTTSGGRGALCSCGLRGNTCPLPRPPPPSSGAILHRSGSIPTLSAAGERLQLGASPALLTRVARP